MAGIPFQIINWSEIPKQKFPGETGLALWQTIQKEGLRIRTVTYSPGYLADHWCQKGHLVYCLEGSCITEMDNGERFELTQGQSYLVSDGLSSHRSYSKNGVTLFIVDGEFLK